MSRLRNIIGIIILAAIATSSFAIFTPRDRGEPEPTAPSLETSIPVLTDPPTSAKINKWQKEFSDLVLAIFKLFFTIVVLLLVLALASLPFIRILSPKLGLKILYSFRRVRSRLRRPQIVVACFENITSEESDYLVKIVRMCIVEELRKLLARDGDIGEILVYEASPDETPKDSFKAQMSTSIDDKIRNKFEKALDELVGEVEMTEIKLLALIVRYFFPVPGFKIEGILGKVGSAPHDHCLVIELTDLATEEIYQSHQIWCKTTLAAHAKKNEFEGVKNAHYQLGLIYESKGLYSKARGHFEEAIKEDPMCQDTFDVLIRVLEKEYSDSAQIYHNLARKAALWVGSQLIADKLEKGKPKEWQAESLNRLGYLFMKEEMYGEALKKFAAASKKHPEWFMSYWNMGDIYSFQGKYSQSVEAYEEALKYVEKDSEQFQGIQVAKACTLLLMGKEEEARSIIDQVDKKEIIDFTTIYNLACYYSHIGELDNALRLLEKIKPQMSPGFLEWVKKDPDLGNVQESPKFKEKFS